MRSSLLLCLAPLVLLACEDEAATPPDAFITVRDVGFFERDGAPPLPTPQDGGAVDVPTPPPDEGAGGEGGGGGGEGGAGGGGAVEQDAGEAGPCDEGTFKPCEDLCGMSRCCGLQRCTNGAWEDCAPYPERCNDHDDNCDEEVDETFPVGMGCINQDGACSASGINVCNEEGTGVICEAEAVEATDEVCDGLDNDCDGDVDEGFVEVCCTEDVHCPPSDECQEGRCVPRGGGPVNPTPGGAGSCNSPIPLSNPGSYSGDTSQGQPMHFGECSLSSMWQPEVIYSFMVNEPTRVRLDTIGSFNDLTIYVRTNCMDAFSEVACDKDSGDGLAEPLVEMTAEAGVRYFVFVDAGTFGGGPFTLHYNHTGSLACSEDWECALGEICVNQRCEPAPPPECTEDVDCPGDQICESQECVNPPACAVDADCGAYVCEAGECVPCESDARCGVGMVCERGACVEAPECEVDGDCGARQACQEGACVDLPCERDDHCEGDLVCRAGACVPPPECEADGECDGGRLCVDFMCVDCRADDNCNGGLVCEQNTCVACQSDVRCLGALICEAGVCVDPLCETDADCGGEVCQGGRCGACMSDAECAGSQICEAGLCQAPECNIDGDCEGDMVCEAGRCEPILTPCESQADCVLGEYCVLGNCHSGTSCEIATTGPQINASYLLQTTGRPDDIDGSCGNGGSESVFAFGGGPRSLLALTTNAEFNTMLSVRTACEASESEIACSDDLYAPANLNRPWISMIAEEGASYYAVAEGVGVASGELPFIIMGAEIPAQCGNVWPYRDFAPDALDAIVEEMLLGIAGDTSNYTNNLTPSCQNNSDAPEAVVGFIPPIDMQITAYTQEAFDTVVYVYGEDCATEITCNDDGGEGLNGQVDFLAEAGKVYYIVVDGYSSRSGEFELVIEPSLP